jgi:multidrug efflux pump subunit AcrB
MMSAPLGVIGASLALNVAHAPFGFVALRSSRSPGMDMRNSIILVDQVRQDTRARRNIMGDHRRDDRRVRPVALTAAFSPPIHCRAPPSGGRWR